MTKEKENELILRALQSSDVEQAVNQVCRHIIIERLRDTPMNDRQLRIALENVVGNMEFQVEMKAEISDNKNLAKQPQNDSFNRIGYIATIIAGAVLALFSFFVVRLLGVLLILGTATWFLFKSSRPQATSLPVNNPVVKLKVKSTVGDIAAKIESCYNSMQPLFGFNQLDGRYRHVLEWLQNAHSRLTPEKRTDVEELLKDLGYEFVAFDDSLGDFFEFCQANVPSMVTSKHAVRNIVTGKFILNGIVVFPIK